MISSRPEAHQLFAKVGDGIEGVRRRIVGVFNASTLRDGARVLLAQAVETGL
jgi:hypothetical protein